MSPTKKKTPPDQRIFVEQGRRHFRRTYSAAEVRIGAVIVVALLVVLGWVIWKGAHPDPELFSTGLEHLADAPERIQGEEPNRAAPAESAPSRGASYDGGGEEDGGPHSATEGAGSVASTTAPAPSGDRGGLPTGLAAPGWTEGPVSRFDETNLYVKIDGREDYYKSFGFRHLTFVSLTADDDDSRTVDIEMYDMGTAPNALGAYSGERSADVKPIVGATGMHHVDRNALFLTRGRLYVRAIGSEESPAVAGELDHLLGVLERSLPGEPLPWAYALFTGELGLDPGKVSYTPENAFSFEFADSVYSATLADGETELFVMKTDSEDAARKLTGEFHGGFLNYGTDIPDAKKVSWVKDRYLGTVAGAVSTRVWLMGVRGAPDVPSAERELARLTKAVATLSAGGPSRD